MPSFAYCFTAPPDSGYPPILNQHIIEAGMPLTVDGPGGDITILPFRQEHGEISSLGFRVHNFAYSCDLSGIPAESRDCRVRARPSGCSMRSGRHRTPAISASQRRWSWSTCFEPRHAVLTNLHIDLDYAQTDAMTPEHVRPAFDGLQIDVVLGEILSPR